MRLHLSVIKKPIKLADFSDKKINALNKKKIKDKVIRSVYPKSEICSLMAEEKLTKPQKMVDTAIGLFTSLVDVVRPTKQIP